MLTLIMLGTIYLRKISRGAGMSITPKSRNILERWNITVEELTAAVEQNGSLRGLMLGYVAEIKLREILALSPLVSSMEKDDDHNRAKKGDLRIKYRGEEFTIESKSLQTGSIKRMPDGTRTGKAQVDASDRRAVHFPDGTTVDTTLLLKGEFDILAVNLFAFDEEWRFSYALNRDLPSSTYRKYTPVQREALIASLVTVSWPPKPPFTDDLFTVLDRLVEERQHSLPEDEPFEIRESKNGSSVRVLES
jgi:hypothetical protein